MARGNESRIREVPSKGENGSLGSPNGSASSQEVAELRAQCKELQAESSRAVELTVEITSLRNQARPYPDIQWITIEGWCDTHRASQA